MAQIITTYLLDDLDEPMSMAREEFYESQLKAFKTTGKLSRSCELVDLILFTPDKKIILQKRSQFKNENTGLLDNAIGGHVLFGRSPSFTVMTSTLRELNVPTFIYGANDDIKETLKLLKNHWHTSAVVQFLDRRTANFKKTYNGEAVIMANTYNLYVGVYGGPITPNTDEAEATLFFTIDELEKEIKNNSEQFTQDFLFFYSEYHTKITQFLKHLDQVQTPWQKN